MKKIVLAALAACFILACKTPGPSSPTAAGGSGAKPAKANPVVVVLNVEKIMKDSKLSKDIQDDLKTWAEGRQADLQGRMEAIRRAEAEKSRPPKELEAMKMELYRQQEMSKQEFQQRQEGAGERMRAAFDPLVQSLAKENGWDVVLNKSEQITIFAGEALDQTDFVIQRLNSAPAPTATPSQTPKP